MKHTRIILFCTAVIFSLFLSTPGSGDESSYFTVDREFYPYYPSLVKWNKSKAPFTEPEVCAGCHPKQYEEWTGSAHALAFQDPVYQGELNKGFKAVGHEVTRQCEGCHSPAGMVTGEIKGPGLKGLGKVALAGVSCDICHSVSGVTHRETPSREPGNGSIILTPGKETADGVRLTKYGPSKPAEGCGGGFHDCVESSLHVNVELCAACHQITHYKSHFPLESTYAEWKRSTYAQKGILCQDCHMVDIATFIRTADTLTKPDRSQYHHYFGGANYLLYYLAETAARKAGDEKLAANLKQKYEMAVAKLKAAAELELSPVYRNGALAEVRVRVRNIRAGHNLPTSLTNVRQMWLEVTARDAAGNVVLTSGGFDSPGTLIAGTRQFTSEGMDTEFHFAIDPWQVTGFSQHETIPPRGFKDAFFSVAPIKKQGAVAVEASLRYRQADQKVAMKLLDALPEDMSLERTYGIKYVPALPIVEMAKKKASFKSKE